MILLSIYIISFFSEYKVNTKILFSSTFYWYKIFMPMLSFSNSPSAKKKILKLFQVIVVGLRMSVFLRCYRWLKYFRTMNIFQWSRTYALWTNSRILDKNSFHRIFRKLWNFSFFAKSEYELKSCFFYFFVY